MIYKVAEHVSSEIQSSTPLILSIILLGSENRLTTIYDMNKDVFTTVLLNMEIMLTQTM